MRALSMHTSLRWLAVAAVLALLATACGADEETDDAAAAQAQASGNLPPGRATNGAR